MILVNIIEELKPWFHQNALNAVFLVAPKWSLKFEVPDSFQSLS